MTDTIPDFTDVELKLVNQTLLERYGRMVALQTADAEVQLNPESEDLTNCPVIYWEERGAHFVAFKLGPSLFKAQFFYNETTQFGTGKESFDNLGDCVITLLQVQADHEQQMQGVRSGMTSLDFKEDTGDGYTGPLVI
ncbi:MAG: hypothetical protein KJ634_09115 [Gammaproteobacteria bacterium]|nr:hypothetical protein [Gammaproteobacteria bacterium]MBU1415766.1 hypothetical protein [Gammaproteobacteria bacterium]